MFKKLFSIFAALTLSMGQWATAPAEVLPKITEAPNSWAGEYVITAMKDDITQNATPTNYGSANYYSLTLFGTVASQPEETKYYAKNNWDGAKDEEGKDKWTWKEMTLFTENVYALDSVVFGGTGFNINTKADDNDALWISVDKIALVDEGDDTYWGPTPPVKRDTIFGAPRRTGGVLEAPKLLAGDTINLFFNAADSTLKAAVLGRPAAPKYYAKNNWDGAKDEEGKDKWTWKEMTQFKENVFTLNDVVFGGTGFNINTKEDDTDALDFDLEDIEVIMSDRRHGGDPGRRIDSQMVAPRRIAAYMEPLQLLAGDTIDLFFNAADSTLKAEIIGRPAALTNSIFTLPNEEKIGGEAVKFFHNGQLYIRKEEKTYNAAGVAL